MFLFVCFSEFLHVSLFLFFRGRFREEIWRRFGFVLQRGVGEGGAVDWLEARDRGKELLKVSKRAFAGPLSSSGAGLSMCKTIKGSYLWQ